MDPVMIIGAISALSKLVQEFRRTKSWASEEEKWGFESKVRAEMDELFDNDPSNDPERWTKRFQNLKGNKDA